MGAVSAVLQAVAAVVADRRSYRRPPSQRLSMKLSLFAAADGNAAFDHGWFKNQFRCIKTSFDSVVQMIGSHWDRVHGPIGHNAEFFVRDRVAVTLFYLTHSGGLFETAQVFGMSKTSAIRYIKQVTDIIVDCLGPIVVCLPESQESWDELSNGFEAICGFPNCCLAMDGSLFEIERPRDFEGWYCRKGWPAINIQLVVDHRTRIRSYDMRPGSANDKSIFNYSQFGRTIDQVLPPHQFVVADAGYTLSQYVMTPYPEDNALNAQNAQFNYLHSRTRITVERAIGMIKNRFRILKLPLNAKADSHSGRSEMEQMGRIIESCFILHNVFIDLNDQPPSENVVIDANVEISHDPVPIRAAAIRDGIALYLYANRATIKSMYG